MTRAVWMVVALWFVKRRGPGDIPRAVVSLIAGISLFDAMLIAGTGRRILITVTGFTIAHSITLAMAMTGLIELPPRIVEPLIALSIAWIAIENVLTSDLKPWSPGCERSAHGCPTSRPVLG